MEDKCIGLWLQGLLGDVILASTYFQHILDKYPDHKWIIVHSYKEEAKVPVVQQVLQPYFDNGRIIKYVWNYMPACYPMPKEVKDYFNSEGVDDIIELMFANFNKDHLTKPRLEIAFSKPTDYKKAIMMRKSSWNPHFLERNRPYEEWERIEKTLVKYGFTPYLVGVEDDMPLACDESVDLRNSFTVRELLEFSADAAYCISCTTFLPVFTQFVCPTIVICDPRDEGNQQANWKLTDNYIIVPAGNKIEDRIEPF